MLLTKSEYQFTIPGLNKRFVMDVVGDADVYASEIELDNVWVENIYSLTDERPPTEKELKALHASLDVIIDGIDWKELYWNIVDDSYNEDNYDLD